MPDGSITVVLPDSAQLESLGDLPGALNLVRMDGDASLDPVALRAEVIVLGGRLVRLARDLGAFPSLRVVQSVSAGVEWLVNLVPPGVTLCNGSGIHDVAVAEWIIGVTLSSLRELPRYGRAQAAGTWDRVSAPVRADDLPQKVVLIVGYGSIGKALEKRLDAFGVRIIRVARHRAPGVHSSQELPGLWAQADVVVILAPLTDETRHLVDAKALEAMRNGTLVVNAARGGLVDHVALERELRAGRLFAALDVTEPEPLPDGHSLWRAPNCIITPHVGGVTRRSTERAYAFVGDQLRRYALGQPLQNVRHGY